MSAIKGQDIVVLLKLASLRDRDRRGHLSREQEVVRHSDPYTVRSLATDLGISKSEVNDSIRRSLVSGLARRSRVSDQVEPNRRHLLEFIVHGLKFVFPALPGAMTRGLPTAFAMPMLRERLGGGGEFIYVWPDAEADAHGQAVAPLFRSVPQAVRLDARLYEYLALVDAIRLGRPRERGLASDLLSERLLAK